ncbi:MotA/TolQ/ExbB proton channel family protein [Alteromonas facilis]|uniref:MotA/TolQ/ExbB proton channel family protein n=1 Tax=Alteromonas facilis TaxID=2048004 RepID=UPI000C28D576|nr:MotA/TolQ/ExbB proton channel family protein [Alteromonas facilis]
MPVFLDNLFPWLGDMLELGGDILFLIIVIAAFMWALIVERVVFFYMVLPSKQRVAYLLWQTLPEHKSWHAGQFRQLLISRLSRDMQRNLQLIRTMVKVCPLLGLLGTVLGMLEIFDALAITGNNSARTTAGGVSKATVSTMAGMVVAISGLMVSNYLIKKADVMKLVFLETFRMDENHKRIRKVNKHA